VHLSYFDQLASGLDGVRTQTKDGLRSWRYHGRVVARALDADHVVLRTSFEARDQLVQKHPGTFSVPARFAKHMMVVAALPGGDAGVIEHALMAAWSLQAAHG